ncbi:MAG TPA: hypothetical protein PLN41_07110 [Methanothrix sp.]|nr:hypothetical protein [Methanothrix sp.]HNT72772.1 hypothetical protein [Methanothrix sp.]HOI69495.1 hypothetical protein [Methanothrix sp.]
MIASRSSGDRGTSSNAGSKTAPRGPAVPPSATSPDLPRRSLLPPLPSRRAPPAPGQARLQQQPEHDPIPLGPEGREEPISLLGGQTTAVSDSAGFHDLS